MIRGIQYLKLVCKKCSALYSVLSEKVQRTREKLSTRAQFIGFSEDGKWKVFYAICNSSAMWLRLNIVYSQIQSQKTLDWQKLQIIYIGTLNGVYQLHLFLPKHRLYNSFKLNILNGLIMFIYKNNQYFYLKFKEVVAGWNVCEFIIQRVPEKVGLRKLILNSI